MASFSAADIYALRDLLSLKGSVFHRTAAFVVSQADRESDSYRSSVWLLEGDGPARPVTSPEFAASSPCIDGSGSRLAFLSSRGGEGKRVHLLDLDGGEARPCGRPEHPIQTIEGWSPDGDRLLLTVSAPWSEDDLDNPDAKQRPVVVRFLPYKLDGSGPTVGHRTHLVALDTRDGSSHVLAGGDVEIGSAAWSPDGRQVAYIRDRRGRQRHRKDLYVVDADGGGERQLTHDLTSVLGLRWSPDGKTIAVAGSEIEGEAVSFLWLVDVASGEVRKAVDDELEILGSSITWSADGSRMAVIAERHGRATPAVVDVASRTCTVHRGNLRQASALAAWGDRLLFIAATMRRPPELFSCTWDGSDERRHTRLNAWFRERPRPRVSLRRMRVPDGEGGQESIDVWLLKPPRGDGPWPTLLYMHGGPESFVLVDQGRQMYWYELCEKGWLIVAPNAVGSSSYGAAFARRLRGHWGERDLPQFLAVLDTLREEGLVGDRIGCGGKSYGGFLSAWALGHTDRFTAGLISAPVANVLSHLGTSDTGFYVTPYAMDAEPTEDAKAYKQLSPLVAFDKLNAPTLFLHGQEDARCPLGQTEELFTRAVRRSEAEVTMVVYPGGSHTMSSSGQPSHREDYNRRCARWLLEKA
ncbi:S9 family peptidase [Luteibacter sp. NPDC031894]|uniref:S9 family peptidase n=1 Tax=Luteibacter sp. NPDC031894 TaxID=3390572 RepID=UPI003D042233